MSIRVLYNSLNYPSRVSISRQSYNERIYSKEASCLQITGIVVYLLMSVGDKYERLSCADTTFARISITHDRINGTDNRCAQMFYNETCFGRE